MIKSKYYAYRYFLVPFDQVSVFQNSVGSKNDIIINILKKVEEQNKTSKIISNTRYLVYYIGRIDNDTVVYKFAKEKKITLREEGDYDIEDKRDFDYPYIYFIINYKHQIILIQKNTSVFNHTSDASNLLEKWIPNSEEMYDYNFSIDPITYEHSFWEHVKSGYSISELNLTLKSPNLFDGLIDTNELLKKLKNVFNNNTTTIKLSNDKGKLHIPEENVKNHIKYITAGGGKWELEMLINGKSTCFSSIDNIKHIEIPREFDQFIHEKQTKDYLYNKIDEIDELLRG
jgi:hypothetical protein